MARNYSPTTEKKLYVNAAGRCSMDTCRIELILETQPGDKDCQIGQIAHIVAHSKTGPRANATYPSNKINSYENLILLCPTCHATVDNLTSKYSVEVLYKIKSNHEAWVSQQFDQAIVTFAELEVAAKAIASGQHATNSDFHVITPEEKIQKNDLTQETKTLILRGLSRSKEVANYLVIAAQGDARFPETLANGFKVQYLKLKQTTSGDALFTDMFEFAKHGQHDFSMIEASLALLTHLFHLCEVFEK